MMRSVQHCVPYRPHFRPYFVFHCLLLLFSSSCASQKESAAPYKGFGKATISADDIQRFTPTPIKTAWKEKVEKALDMRFPWGGLWDKKTGHIFFQWNVSGVPHIWKTSVQNPFPQQLTGGEDMTSLLGSLPAQKKLIVLRDKNGEEFPGIYLLSFEGGPLEKVFHEPNVQAQYQGLSDDELTLYFRANQDAPSSYALYRYHIPTQKIEKFFNETGLWFIADIKGEELVLGRYKSNTTHEYFTYSMTKRQLVPLVGQLENENFSVQFAPTANEYFIVTNKFRDFLSLYLYRPLKKGADVWQQLSPDWAGDIENTSIDRTRQRLLISLNDQGLGKIYYYDTQKKRVVEPYFHPAEKKNPQLIARQRLWGKTDDEGQTTFYAVEDDAGPRKNYLYHWATGKSVQWSRASLPETAGNEFVLDELAYFRARDQSLVPYFQYVPKSCQNPLTPCPVVVNYHGGPEGQSRPGFSSINQLFVQEGYILIFPNVRGSTGYGKKYLDADNGVKRLEVISDVEDCVLHLKEKFAVQGLKPAVGILGGSYGGYVSLLGMTKYAGLYDAGVSIVGISDLLSFLKNTASYRQALRVSEYGDPVKDEMVLRKLSPINYLDQLKGPLLLIHGVNDPRVPAGELVQIYKQATAKNLTAQLVLFPDEGHGLIKKSNKVLQYGYIFDFFERVLKNKK